MNKKNVYDAYITYFAIIAIAYALPPVIASVFLIGLFSYGIFIKKDIVKWVALFLFIANSPGFIFSFADANYDLAKLGIGLIGDRGFSFQELFILLLFFYALIRKDRFRSVFKGTYIMIVIYITVMFVFSLDSLSFFKILKTFRGFIPHLAFFFLPVLFTQSTDYKRLAILLIPFPLFVIFVQFFELATQKEMILTLGSSLDWGRSIGSSSSIARQNYSQVLLLFILFSAFYLLRNASNSIYSRRFIFLIIGVINVSIFISATRGYFLASFIGTILFMMISFKPVRVIQFSFYALIIAAIGLKLPILQNQFRGAYERIVTIGEIATDLEGAGMEETSRIVYFKDVMDKVYEKPIFGYGVSQQFYDYANVHSGFPTNLLNGGLLGLFIILFFFATLYIKTLKSNDKNLKLVAYALSMYIIVHATSNYIFNFIHLTQADSRGLVIPLLYSFFSLIIMEKSLKRSENV